METGRLIQRLVRLARVDVLGMDDGDLATWNVENRRDRAVAPLWPVKDPPPPVACPLPVERLQTNCPLSAGESKMGNAEVDGGKAPTASAIGSEEGIPAA